VNTFETGIIPDSEIEKIVKELFDLTPNGIMHALDLRKPIYKKTAVYGHFGRDIFPWEKTDMADKIKSLAGKLGA
jgi:S-adenosylmethionine synthetase